MSPSLYVSLIGKEKPQLLPPQAVPLPQAPQSIEAGGTEQLSPKAPSERELSAMLTEGVRDQQHHLSFASDREPFKSVKGQLPDAVQRSTCGRVKFFR